MLTRLAKKSQETFQTQMLVFRLMKGSSSLCHLKLRDTEGLCNNNQSLVGLAILCYPTRGPSHTATVKTPEAVSSTVRLEAVGAIPKVTCVCFMGGLDQLASAEPLVKLTCHLPYPSP